jgi:murein DD-endopeptidase MepM/ murein hydrolase activator NlpD
MMNSKRPHWVVVLMTLLTVAVVTSVAKAETLGWVLPFKGTASISHGPNEGLHKNKSSEAIDYVSVTCMAVRAPYDGTVINVLSVADFGTVVRINHQNTGTSFFAHLNPNSILVSAGNTVYQGLAIATSGNSGTGGQNCHLHFEARTGVTAGDVYSGQSEPIRAIPGTWWNSFYSPPPNFQNDPSRHSGGAQNPERNVQPSIMLSTGRHLANVESPPNRPAAHISDITNTQVTLHGGGAPSTPGNANLKTWFQFEEFRYSTGAWAAPSGSYTSNPIFTRAKSSTNQCNINGQHCHRVWSQNTLRGWSTSVRYIELWHGETTTRTPHISATYEPGDATTVLEFYTPGVDRYNVWRERNGVVSEVYNGRASSILTERALTGNDDHYMVRVHYTADNTWSPQSLWLIVHW